MNLGVFEALLLRALRPALPDDIELVAGPLAPGATSGARPQVFVHAARFDDGGGVTPEGAHVARLPWSAAAGASGFAEDRPVRIEIDLHLLAALPWQAQWLAGRCVGPAWRALEGLASAALADAEDAGLRLDLMAPRTAIHALRFERLVHDGVALHHGQVTLRVEGPLHCRLAAPGGLARGSAYAGLAPAIEIVSDPPGPDRDAEHLRLRNPGPVALELSGWSVEDNATRVHRYRFPSPTRLAAGGELRLFTGRGKERPGFLYWGRRQAVWNNRGDVAILRDPEGVERGRAVCSPPAPAPRKQPRSR
jgi:hypothetical protein